MSDTTNAPDPGDAYKEAVADAEQHFAAGIESLLALGDTPERILTRFKFELARDRIPLDPKLPPAF